MSSRTPPLPCLLTLVLALSSWGALSCDPSLDRPGAQWELWDESGEELRRLPAVPRLHLRGVRQIALEDFWMLQGEVSAATGKKLAAREMPAAASAKRLPLSAWTAEDDIIFAPGQPLVAGGIYTLVALGVGVLAELRAADEPSEVWTRWGQGSVLPGAHVAYCKMNHIPAVEFAPAQGELHEQLGEGGMGGVGASLEEPVLAWGLPGGLFAQACITLQVSPVAGDAFVPPAGVAQQALDPQAIWLEKQSPVAETLAWETSLPEQGCAGKWGVSVCAQGAALLVTNSSLRHLALEIFDGGAQVGQVALSAAVSSVRIGPIEAQRSYTLRGLIFDERDVRQNRAWSGTVRSGPGQAQFVITEVMADPLGPEPQGEWIELQNIGTIDGSLNGYFLGDEAGWSALPDMTLAPGQFGLIVRRDFAVTVPVPVATALPLVVEQLGGNGLRNSGELVQLRGPDGSIKSAMSAIKSPEGISLARTAPWAPDQPDSFASHGAPGASPGADNTF